MFGGTTDVLAVTQVAPCHQLAAGVMLVGVTLNH